MTVACRGVRGTEDNSPGTSPFEGRHHYCHYPTIVWPQASMVGVMEVTATSFKRTYARTVVFSAPDPMAGHCQPMPLLEIPGHSQATLAQSLVG